MLDNDNPPPFGPSQPPLPSGTNINLFNPPRPPTALNNLNVVENVPTIPSIYNKGIRNDMSGSQAAMATPSVTKKRPDKEIDDFLYKLPDTGMPDLVLGDGLIQILGTTAKDLFDDNAPPQKKEQEHEILKDILDEYNVDDIKDTMDETGQIPESIYFFYGGDSQTFVNALEFIGLSPINREFAAFLLFDLGRRTMT